MRTRLIVALAAVGMLLLCSCTLDLPGLDGDEVREHPFNAATPLGVRVWVPPEAPWSATFTALALEVVDAEAPPLDFVVVLHRPLSEEYDPLHWEGITFYVDRSEIHVRVHDIGGVPTIPSLRHEVEHARCRCRCIPDHANDAACR